jgi:hypothetical protein
MDMQVEGEYFVDIERGRTIVHTIGQLISMESYQLGADTPRIDDEGGLARLRPTNMPPDIGGVALKNELIGTP